MTSGVTPTLAHANGKALLQLLPGGQACQQAVTTVGSECLGGFGFAHLHHPLVKLMRTGHAVHIVGHRSLVVGEHHTGKRLVVTQQLQGHSIGGVGQRRIEEGIVG